MKANSYFSPSDIKPIQSIQGWEEFWRDGKAFLKTATMAHGGRKRAFTAEILYNIIAMAIEKFVMAALMRHGAMPYNHTMKDLIEAMEETFPGDIAELHDGLLNLDRYQEICDIDAFSITPPDIDEIPDMLDLAGKIQTLVTQRIMV